MKAPLFTINLVGPLTPGEPWQYLRRHLARWQCQGCATVLYPSGLPVDLASFAHLGADEIAGGRVEIHHGHLVADLQRLARG